MFSRKIFSDDDIDPMLCSFAEASVFVNSKVESKEQIE